MFFLYGYTISLLFVMAVYLVPISRILRRAGLNGWFCLLAVIPVLNLVMLWVFAYVAWPALPVSLPDA